MYKLNNVSYQYFNRNQTIEAVKNVNVEFERGKFYVINGKSGSGKTTLISLLAALDKPSKGEILIDNVSLSNFNDSNYRLFKAAVIYQNYNLFPLLTVYENILLPLQLQKIEKSKAKDIVNDSLIKVGLDDKYFKRFPFMLSGGEQQRVAIARALASGSEIILADEPTGNLDAENSLTVASILCKLAHEDNKLIITATHDLDITALADVVFEMSNGQLSRKQ